MSGLEVPVRNHHQRNKESESKLPEAPRYTDRGVDGATFQLKGQVLSMTNLPRFVRDLSSKFRRKTAPTSRPVTAQEFQDASYRCPNCFAVVRGEGILQIDGHWHPAVARPLDTLLGTQHAESLSPDPRRKLANPPGPALSRETGGSMAECSRRCRQVGIAQSHGTVGSNVIKRRFPLSQPSRPQRSSGGAAELAQYWQLDSSGEYLRLFARSCILNGERGKNRTYNLLIKSQLLCQLSYAP